MKRKKGSEKVAVQRLRLESKQTGERLKEQREKDGIKRTILFLRF